MSDDLPLPIARVTPDEAMQRDRMLQEAATDLANPMSTVLAFLSVLERLGTLDEGGAWDDMALLCVDLAPWGDFESTKLLIGDRGLASNVHYSKERPSQLAYVRLVDVGDQEVRFFADALLPDVVFMHLVRDSLDSHWLMWGVSRGRAIPASEIFLD